MNNDFTKGFVNSKPTRLVGIGVYQNKDKLGRQTVEELREERIRFNQRMENEHLFKKNEEEINIANNENDDEAKRNYLSSLQNLNKKWFKKNKDYQE